MADTWTEYSLECGDLRLTVLPGLGGRLWQVTFAKRPLLFQNSDLAGRPVDLSRLADLPTRSPQFGFPLWGGEKTWIAPNTEWGAGAPSPVLDSGAYAVVCQSSEMIAMESEVCPDTHLSVKRTIEMTSPREWTLHHRIVNRGQQRRMTGIWSVMMLNRPAQLGTAAPHPMARPVFGDVGACVDARAGTIVCRCAGLREFKIGLPNPTGRTLIRCDDADLWLLCENDPPAPEDRFAHGLPFEVFNSGDYDYCEAEWHSPARDLGAGECLAFTQRFSILSGDLLQRTEKELVACMS